MDLPSRKNVKTFDTFPDSTILTPMKTQFAIYQNQAVVVIEERDEDAEIMLDNGDTKNVKLDDLRFIL